MGVRIVEVRAPHERGDEQWFPCTYNASMLVYCQTASGNRQGNMQWIIYVAARLSGAYLPWDIDKVSERGETWAVDPEMRESLERLGTGLDQLGTRVERLGADLRGEIQTLAGDLRGEIHTSSTSLLQQVREQIRESESGTRLHFDVIAESLRGDIRTLAEGIAASREQTERQLVEQAGRTDRLEGRVLRLQVQVSGLKADRKSRRPRRRR